MDGIDISACRGWLGHRFFLSSFCCWCKSPGPIKDTDTTIKMWTYFDNNNWCEQILTSLKYTVIVNDTHHLMCYLDHLSFYLMHAHYFQKYCHLGEIWFWKTRLSKIQRRSMNTTMNCMVRWQETDQECLIMGCFVWIFRWYMINYIHLSHNCPRIFRTRKQKYHHILYLWQG